MISRTPFPSEDRWETLLNTQDQPPKLLNQIKQLIEIKKKMQKSLHLEFVALENKAQLSEAFKRIKYQYKGLNGVIHAAGIPGGGVAQLKSVETFQKVLQPKLFGTQNLLDLLTNEPLDFLCLFLLLLLLLDPQAKWITVLRIAFWTLILPLRFSILNILYSALL